MIKNCWRIIAKSLGEKAGISNKESDQIAFIRFLFALLVVLTNIAIISNVIHHW